MTTCDMTRRQTTNAFFSTNDSVNVTYMYIQILHTDMKTLVQLYML